MPISNSFAVPAASRSFTLSLVDYNSSLTALFSNFYGPAVPTLNNITIQGVSTSPYEGMLYRSSITNSFYVYDPTNVKGGGIGGGFTRNGIGSRNFESITALTANLSLIEQSELLTTVGDSTANYRVYMKTNNSNGFVDIGIPPASSLTSGMFINRQIPNTALQLNTVTAAELSKDIDLLGRTKVVNVVEPVVNVSISGGAVTLDLYYGSAFHTNLTAAITSVSVINANSTHGSSFVWFTTSDGVSHNITWDSSTYRWTSATPLTPTTGTGVVDIYSGYKVHFLNKWLISSGGTNY
jgi:hypothetical protein